MKKLKLLTPILGLTATAGMIVPMAVSCKGGEEEVTTFTVTINEGITLVDANTAELNQKFETDIAFDNTKIVTYELDKKSQEPVYDIRIKVGSHLLTQGTDFTYIPAKTGTGLGHLIIEEDIVDGNITIDAKLGYDLEHLISARVYNNGEGYATTSLTNPYALSTQDATFTINWHDTYEGYDHFLNHIYVYNETRSDVEILPYSSNNRYGYVLSNWTSNSVDITIPMFNFSTGDELYFSVYLEEITTDGSFTCSEVEQSESLIPGKTWNGLKSPTPTIDVPWVEANDEYSIVADISKIDGFDRNAPVYAYFTYQVWEKDDSGEYSWSDEHIFSFLIDSRRPLNHFGYVYEGTETTLKVEMKTLEAVGAASVFAITPGDSGWGEHLMALTSTYEFQRNYTPWADRSFGARFMAHVGQLSD